MLSTVFLRRAEPGDEEAVARVHVRSWPVAYRGLLPDDYPERLSPAGQGRSPTPSPTSALARRKPPSPWERMGSVGSPPQVPAAMPIRTAPAVVRDLCTP